MFFLNNIIFTKRVRVAIGMLLLISMVISIPLHALEASDSESSSVHLSEKQLVVYTNIAHFLFSKKMCLRVALMQMVQDTQKDVGERIEEEGIGQYLKKYLGDEGFKHYKKLEDNERNAIKGVIINLGVQSDTALKARIKELEDNEKKLLKATQEETQVLYTEVFDKNQSKNTLLLGKQFFNSMVLATRSPSGDELLHRRKNGALFSSPVLFLTKEHATNLLQTELENAKKMQTNTLQVMKLYADAESHGALQKSVEAVYAPRIQILTTALERVKQDQQPFDASSFVPTDERQLAQHLDTHIALVTQAKDPEAQKELGDMLRDTFGDNLALWNRSYALALELIKQKHQTQENGFGAPIFAIPTHCTETTEESRKKLFATIINHIEQRQKQALPAAAAQTKARLAQLATAQQASGT